MPGGARRLPARLWRPLARRVLLVSCLWLTMAGGAVACGLGWWAVMPISRVTDRSALWHPPSGRDPDKSISAAYYTPTDRYGHGALPARFETTTLRVFSKLTTSECGAAVTLDPPHVFEDVLPRLVDLTGNGLPEVITVRSHETLGAQVAIYALDPETHHLSLAATTPYIGTRFRWLALLGAADLDGDGTIEIAYIDRPHLAKVLRIWRLIDGEMTEVASFGGFTNHRYGEAYIAGGILTCANGSEMILSNADWTQLLALRFRQGDIAVRQIGQDTSRDAFYSAMNCKD